MPKLSKKRCVERMSKKKRVYRKTMISQKKNKNYRIKITLGETILFR